MWPAERRGQARFSTDDQVGAGGADSAAGRGRKKFTRTNWGVRLPLSRDLPLVGNASSARLMLENLRCRVDLGPSAGGVGLGPRSGEVNTRLLQHARRAVGSSRPWALSRSLRNEVVTDNRFSRGIDRLVETTTGQHPSPAKAIRTTNAVRIAREYSRQQNQSVKFCATLGRGDCHRVDVVDAIKRCRTTLSTSPENASGRPSRR